MNRWSSDNLSLADRSAQGAETLYSRALESNASNVSELARLNRLLADAQAARRFAHTLALASARQRVASHQSHFDPNQPRVPAGNSDGGQWTNSGAIGAGASVAGGEHSAFSQRGLVMSDASPDGIRVWTQYAQAENNSNRDAAAVARTTVILHNIVTQVSAAVLRRLGSSPREYGTDVHTAFARVVREPDLPGIGKKGVEQSFDREGEARYGKDGSITTDVVLRNEEGKIIAIYDLKIGSAIIRPSRAAELRAMTGAGPDVPVIELHSSRPPKRR
jgi:hypothetical protein